MAGQDKQASQVGQGNRVADGVYAVGTMMRHRSTSVVVEYDGPDGSRISKQFPKATAARRFYLAQAQAGHNPTLKTSK